jgi:hypothetical protein
MVNIILVQNRFLKDKILWIKTHINDDINDSESNKNIRSFNDKTFVTKIIVEHDEDEYNEAKKRITEYCDMLDDIIIIGDIIILNYNNILDIILNRSSEFDTWKIIFETNLQKQLDNFNKYNDLIEIINIDEKNIINNYLLDFNKYIQTIQSHSIEDFTSEKQTSLWYNILLQVISIPKNFFELPVDIIKLTSETNPKLSDTSKTITDPSKYVDGINILVDILEYPSKFVSYLFTGGKRIKNTQKNHRIKNTKRNKYLYIRNSSNRMKSKLKRINTKKHTTSEY